MSERELEQRIQRIATDLSESTGKPLRFLGCGGIVPGLQVGTQQHGMTEIQLVAVVHLQQFRDGTGRIARPDADGGLR